MANIENTSKEPFIIVPNALIIHSMSECKDSGKYTLPIYLYAATHCEHYNDRFLCTSIEGLMSYYEIGETDSEIRDTARRMYQAVKYLDDGVSVISYKQGSADVYNKGFKKLIDVFEYPKTRKSDRITMKVGKFLGKSEEDKEKEEKNEYNKYDYHFTLLTYREFYDIINSVRKYNIGKVGKARRSMIDLINMYMYFKMRINQCNTGERAGESDRNSGSGSGSDGTNYFVKCHMDETIDGMSEMTGFGEKTVTKLINQMIDMGLINRVKDIRTNGKSNTNSVSGKSNTNSVSGKSNTNSVSRTLGDIKTRYIYKLKGE